MNIKRLLPFTLAVTILASAVVSCGDTDSTATPDNQPTDNTAAVTEAVTDDPKLAAKTSYFDSLPAFSGTTKEIRFAGDTGDIAVADLTAYIKSKLPRYMIPNVTKQLDELPYTPNGKIDRNGLKSLYAGK